MKDSIIGNLLLTTGGPLSKLGYTLPRSFMRGCDRASIDTTWVVRWKGCCCVLLVHSRFHRVLRWWVEGGLLFGVAMRLADLLTLLLHPLKHCLHFYYVIRILFELIVSIARSTAWAAMLFYFLLYLLFLLPQHRFLNLSLPHLCLHTDTVFTTAIASTVPTATFAMTGA